MLAVELINRAWNLSGLVPRGLDEVTDDQGNDGLFWLNQFLDELSMTGRNIPYVTHGTFNTIIGQEIYTIPSLVQVQELTFNIGPVRYEMVEKNRRRYFGEARVDNIESLTISYYQERILGGTNIYLYFLPSQIFLMKYTGIGYVSNVTFNTDFSTLVDTYYQSYLMYELANRLCDWYKVSLPDQSMATLLSFRDRIQNLNPVDFTVKIVSVLNKMSPFNWGQVNLGHGWTTP
jgi:hypothetical protein